MIDKNGGPAYPATVSVDRDTGEIVTHQFENNGFHCPGMTLLDHFAGLAMQGMLAADDHATYTTESISECAYDTAAAMLRARAKYLESDND